MRLYSPDEVLLRRFGYVRAVGGAAYFAAVAVLAAIYGAQAWPLALGVPVLAVVTTAYFLKSAAYPRTAVIASLMADALVLGGAIAFVGGTGSGAVMVYAIVVVSAGILLGPAAGLGFTVLVVVLSLLQLGIEQAGVQPTLLPVLPLADRVTVLLISLALLASVGYLTAIYADRLHELVLEAGAAAEDVRRRSRKRRGFVQQATVDVQAPLREVEAVAAAITEDWEDLGTEQRRGLAARLRAAVTTLDAGVGLLADVGAMDEAEPPRPEPVLLRRAVDDCLVALDGRLDGWSVDVDLPPLKVVGNPRAVRRVVFSLLENVVEHTPPGTHVEVTAVPSAGHGVLVVTDDGPGVPASRAARLFEGDTGLPLVKELCEAMGADVRYEPARGGGSRFLIGFRLAPTAAPSRDDETVPG